MKIKLLVSAELVSTPSIYSKTKFINVVIGIEFFAAITSKTKSDVKN